MYLFVKTMNIHFNIFDIKKFLSEKTQNPIGQIFIFDFENLTSHYENYVKMVAQYTF